MLLEISSKRPEKKNMSNENVTFQGRFKNIPMIYFLPTLPIRSRNSNMSDPLSHKSSSRKLTRNVRFGGGDIAIILVGTVPPNISMWNPNPDLFPDGSLRFVETIPDRYSSVAKSIPSIQKQQKIYTKNTKKHLVAIKNIL